jgi:hypothetical protein
MAHKADTRSMFIAIALTAAAVGVFGALSAKLGAEDRPGFDERRPLA